MTATPARTRTTLRLSQPLKRVRVTYAGPQPIPGDQKEALERAAYQKGHADASAVFQQQILEQREEMRYLQEDLLAQIGNQYETLEKVIADRLPALAMAMLKKLAPSIEWDVPTLNATLETILADYAPQGEALEVCLCAEDYALLKHSEDNPEERHNGLKLVSQADLQRGDVILRSRFGTVDARIETKVDKLSKDLVEH